MGSSRSFAAPLRGLFAILAFGAGTACHVDPSLKTACVLDTDCNSGRVCKSGVCVSRQQSDDSSGGGAGTGSSNDGTGSTSEGGGALGSDDTGEGGSDTGAGSDATIESASIDREAGSDAAPNDADADANAYSPDADSGYPVRSTILCSHLQSPKRFSDAMPCGSIGALLPLLQAAVPEVDGDAGLMPSVQVSVGDVNGDGREDLALVPMLKSDDNSVYIALSNGNGFDPPQDWESSLCGLSQKSCQLADVNGDGKADLVKPGTDPYDNSIVMVALSQGDHFGPLQTWHGADCNILETCLFGDVTGDGKADFVRFLRSQNQLQEGYVYVMPSLGNDFDVPQNWDRSFCYRSELCALADIDGDGRLDILTFLQGTQQIGLGYVFSAFATSNGTSADASANAFSGSVQAITNFCYDGSTCAAGNISGDPSAELVSFTRNAGGMDVWVATYTGGGMYTLDGIWQSQFCSDDESCLLVDLDGDGKKEFVSVPWRQQQ